VRIAQGALATQNMDLLGDARKRVRFITDLAHGDNSVLKSLQRVDKRFECKPGQNETAINDKGIVVGLLRRQPDGDGPHP
jgi:hypothetical protein